MPVIPASIEEGKQAGRQKSGVTLSNTKCEAHLGYNGRKLF